MTDSVHITELTDTVHKAFKVKANCHACEHDKAVADAKVVSDRFFKALHPLTDIDPANAKHLFVIDSLHTSEEMKTMLDQYNETVSPTPAVVSTADIADASTDEGKRVIFEDKELVENATLSDIPEVKAVVTLMRDRMASIRLRTDLVLFIRKQKLKVLQLDYIKLGGRLRATAKLLAALDMHPDHYEVREDLEECVTALARLVQDLDRKHKLEIAAWCRVNFPLNAEQQEEVFEYEEKVLAKRAESEAAEATAESEAAQNAEAEIAEALVEIFPDAMTSNEQDSLETVSDASTEDRKSVV